MTFKNFGGVPTRNAGRPIVHTGTMAAGAPLRYQIAPSFKLNTDAKTDRIAASKAAPPLSLRAAQELGTHAAAHGWSNAKVSEHLSTHGVSDSTSQKRTMDAFRAQHNRDAASPKDQMHHEHGTTSPVAAQAAHADKTGTMTGPRGGTYRMSASGTKIYDQK